MRCILWGISRYTSHTRYTSHSRFLLNDILYTYPTRFTCLRRDKHPIYISRTRYSSQYMCLTVLSSIYISYIYHHLMTFVTTIVNSHGQRGRNKSESFAYAAVMLFLSNYTGNSVLVQSNRSFSFTFLGPCFAGIKRYERDCSDTTKWFGVTLMHTCLRLFLIM